MSQLKHVLFFKFLQKEKMGFSLGWRQHRHMLRTSLMMLGFNLLSKKVLLALSRKWML
jgi:hypothetical protein